MAGMKVDGFNFSGVHVSSLKRVASVLDGKNAGRAQSGEMLRDVIGTYVNYQATIDANEATLAAYDELFEVLSAPVDYHNIEMPYGQETLVFKAYVTEVSDEAQLITDTASHWGNMSFKFVAIRPQRR